MSMKTATLIHVMTRRVLSHQMVAIVVTTASVYNHHCILLDPINPLNAPILLGEGDERCGLWQDEYIKLHRGVMQDITV